MSQVELLPTSRALRWERRAAGRPAVLIEVPAVTLREPHRAARQRSALTTPREQQARRPKRRLRREVRWAAYALLLAAPIASAGSLGWANRGSRTAGGAISVPEATARSGLPRVGELPQSRGSDPIRRGAFPRVVVLSIEPTTLPESEAEGPVAFPGYLLPDDTFEEVAHEGS